MDIFMLGVVGVVLVFAFVIFFGAPYLPTHKAQADTALDLLNLKKGQRMLELGAGDGTVALAALKRGVKVTAIELNPVLCVVIYIRTYHYRRDITVKLGNFWTTDWGNFDAVYTFLLDKYMNKLDNILIHKNFKGLLASYAFEVPGKKIHANKSGVFVYKY